MIVMVPDDPHHCRCFQLTSLNDDMLTRLVERGFEEQVLQEDHGQILGMRKKLDNYIQIHVKIMKDLSIESEIEYQPEYPFAHTNKTHSYSAHKETQEIFNQLGISYFLKQTPPLTCIKRKIIKAVKPSHWTTVIGGLALAGLVIAAVYYATKEDTEEE